MNSQNKSEKNTDQVESVHENDHKKLGRELDLFTFSDVVGKGLPLWTPKGTTVRRELERWVVDEEIKAGFLHVMTPDIAKLALYEKSGHYPYYKDSMYAPIEIEDEKFMLRPMSCPHHYELFLSRPRSYKEMPFRYAELAKLYRFEQSGELMGLLRVRSFCLADAHIIARKDQTKAEINLSLNLIDKLVGVLGLKLDKDYWYRLSLGDRADSKKYFKSDEEWDHAENILREVLEERDSKFLEAKGEAAFYGPKIDVQMKNANGKEDTAFTVQYDFVMPKRFKLEYVNEKGEKEEAVVIHRSSIGAIERVMAFLIEKYAGAFPVWLAPVQVKVIPISEKNMDYAKSVASALEQESIRVEVDERNEPLGGKIRDAQMQKVPYMLIVGDKEEKENKISERGRSGKDYGVQDLSEFIKNIKKEINEKTIE